MTFFNWLTNTKMELYIVGIWSLFVNTLIKTTCAALHHYVWTNIDFNESVKIIIYVFIATVSAFILAWILNTKIVKLILTKIFNKTIGNDVFQDVIDYNKRTMMMIYLKDSDVYYLGAFKLKDVNGIDSYITLIEYTSYRKDTNEIVRKNSKDLGLKSSITFCLQDIERIEMFYENDSKVWELLNSDNKEINPKEQGK